MQDESSSDENITCGSESARGYRLMSMESLQKFVNRIHSYAPVLQVIICLFNYELESCEYRLISGDLALLSK